MHCRRTPLTAYLRAARCRCTRCVPAQNIGWANWRRVDQPSQCEVVDLIVAALTAQQSELDGMLRDATDADWDTPTRCPGWTVADVVLHLAQTDEFALTSIEGRIGEAVVSWTRTDRGATVDDRAGALVAEQRGAPPQQVLGRWRAAASALRHAFDTVDPSARLTWVAGQVSARTLAATRLSETWIHTGDVAEALGVARTPGPQLEQIVRLAWRTLPYAFARDGKQLAGPVAVELTAPDGETWAFGDVGSATTTVRGAATDFCEVAARRLDSADTSLTATGPDGQDVLALVRTYA
jgi:uncharacterized protein (TIGR03084 family)